METIFSSSCFSENVSHSFSFQRMTSDGEKKWNQQTSEARKNRRRPSIRPALFSVDQAEWAGRSCGEKCTVGGRGRLGSSWEAAAAGLAPSRWRSPGPRLVPLISAQQQIGPFFTASCCEPLLVFLVIPPLPALRVQPGVRRWERPPCWTCDLKLTGMQVRRERWCVFFSFDETRRRSSILRLSLQPRDCFKRQQKRRSLVHTALNESSAARWIAWTDFNMFWNHADVFTASKKWTTRWTIDQRIWKIQ